jgi:hypothetical protein
MNSKRAKGLIIIWAALALCFVLASCSAQRPIHPGAANKFDSDSYDALLVADSIIQSTKADLANNTFPASVAAKMKDALNYLIEAYNATNTSYRVYHAAVAAGAATPVQQAAVQAGLNQIAGATTNLVNAKAVKP